MQLIKKSEMLWVFGFGAIIYALIEVLFRGYTHWSMALAGGLAFSLIYFMNLKIHTQSLIIRCLAGSAIITAIEFTAGLIVNITFHMNVWDYSAERYNILGQICPLFSFAWFLICIPATVFSFLFRSMFCGSKKV